MKTLRKMLKLLPPAFAMRIWLHRRYGINVKSAPGGLAARFALAILPYAFTAALSVRVESDCRLWKYFLPYGRMKKFVKLMYNMQVGDDAKDHGMVGGFRAVMPYGLVLWWDAEERRISGDIDVGNKRNEKVKPGFNDTFVSCRQMAEHERQELVRMDRIEAMTLRLLIVSGGKA